MLHDYARAIITGLKFGFLRGKQLVSLRPHNSREEIYLLFVFSDICWWALCYVQHNRCFFWYLHQTNPHGYRLKLYLTGRNKTTILDANFVYKSSWYKTKVHNKQMLNNVHSAKSSKAVDKHTRSVFPRYSIHSTLCRPCIVPWGEEEFAFKSKGQKILRSLFSQLVISFPREIPVFIVIEKTRD